MRETVTIYVPSGYKDAAEFLRDFEFERVDLRPAWDHPANRSYEPVEKRAKEIYEAFEYDGPIGTTKPAWEPGGNSTKQDQARRIARHELVEAGHISR
jgi:hypothetical protein